MNQNELKRASLQGRGICVKGNDIDTDAIIPARYMTCVTFDGLEEYAFYDERYDQDGSPKDHPFNDDQFSGASILIVNENFGCGSSREHAPQALMRFGIQAIIGESFAEIFAGNCVSLGIPIVTTDQQSVSNLMQQVIKNPQATIQIDLTKKTIDCESETLQIEIPESSRLALINGTWDSLSQLLANQETTKKAAATIPHITPHPNEPQP